MLSTYKNYFDFSFVWVFNNAMPGQHDKNKVFVGGWIPVGLAAGVEKWLDKNPGKDRTAFLFESLLDKLRDAGIEVSFPADYPKGRPRKALPKEAYDLVKEVPPPYRKKKKRNP